MITNTGKNILAKYLLGQTSAYASYIAIGCGAKPLNSDGVLDDYSNKERLDFEMFRVPITSRGYVTEDSVTKIVFTAELPSEERYEISEVGIFSAGSNTAAGAYDSKTIYAFTQDENWQHVDSQGTNSIPVKYTPLDNDSNNVISDFLINRNGSQVVAKVFQTNSDNRIFTDQKRVLKYERCRFLNNIIMLKGNSSNLTIDQSGNIIIDNSSEYIHLTGAIIDFNKNSPTDEIKIAFSIINKDGESSSVPDNVKLLIEFSSSSDAINQFARFQVNVDNGSGIGKQDFATNRYFVATKQLQELYKSVGFTWNQVDTVKIYACVTDSGSVTDNFYIALDSFKLENTSLSNPLYGMTGYSVIKNKDAATIIKAANTTNYIEFRFALDVQ